jgi:hypothetical protein
MNRMLTLSALTLSVVMPAYGAGPGGLKDALSGERLGLLPASHFRVADGHCADCPTLKQGLWYFRGQTLAVPLGAKALSSYAATGDIVRDVRAWAAGGAAGTLEYPGLVWLAAPHILDDAAILPAGGLLRSADGAQTGLYLTPKIASNRSFWDGKTTAFFAQRPVRMRGTYTGEKNAFVARTVWPKDFVIDGARLAVQPLAPGETLRSFVQAEGGGASSPYATRLLWERNPGQPRQWQDKAVIGVMLNGAQGDDDEAFGGHFGIATGHLGKQGEWSDWIVNNFYNLDSYSEKGTIAAPVTMDNYLMDVNSGQSYYRPSYMLVAVLNNARTAVAYQGGVQRVFNHFYRHDFSYRHAQANCAGISVDVFKALGWNVPERGPTSQLKAVGAYAYLAAKDMSLESGRKIYDYLTEEQVRLYPAVAFEALGDDLLQLVGARPGLARSPGAFEKQLQSDVEALVLVRIPQIPSSRAMGSNPVFSFDEFMRRTPPDRADWKIVPVDARPFPAELRDPAVTPVPAPALVPWPVAAIAAGVIGVAGWMRRRRRHAVRSAAAA